MKQSTRLVVATTTVALMGLSLAACSSSGSTGGDDGETLTFWGSYGNGGNSAQQDALEKTLIPAFEKANPGITVDYVDLPYDDLLQKLTTSAAGGELPDLVRSDIGWVPQLAELGVLVPLSEEMDGYDELADATYPGILSTNLYDGKYWGMPLDTNTRVLITDQATLDAAGMSAPPATFDEFKQMGAALQGSGKSLFADSGLGSWNLFPWIWSGGGEVTDADLTTATGYLDDDKSVAAVQMLVDLYKAGSIPNLIIGNEGATGTSDGLPTGEYATILDGPWMKDIWTAQYPDFAPIYAPVPAGDGGSVSVVGGEDIVLASTSEHKDAAMKFIEFTQSEQFQIEMAKTGQMSVVASLADQQSALDPYFEVFAEQLKSAKSRLAIPKASEVDAILSEELTPAFDGSAKVSDALTAAASRIDDLLSED
jgi:multiple sugar transport system substrate-binding protein